MSESGDQLVSFFLYSLFIYPVTNYIVSPQRKYPKWKAALYAVLFLAGVAALHMMHENMEAGPNYYQLLRVDRHTPISFIKKSYRSLSLEFHPDKNKDPGAVETFTKIKHAFDIITDKDKRREYNRLGEHGVSVLAHGVVDYKYILIQLVVYYASSAIFAFLMTFTEPTGDAFQICLFGLTVMLLLEMLLVVHEVQLPVWFLPDTTPHDLVAIMHRLFPAFMNGCRCITGAFYIDRKAVRVAALETLATSTKDLSMRVSSVTRALLHRVEAQVEMETADMVAVEPEDEDGMVIVPKLYDGEENIPPVLESLPIERAIRPVGSQARIGIMGKALKDISRHVHSTKEGRNGSIITNITAKLKLIQDANMLQQRNKVITSTYSPGFLLFRDICGYLLVRYLLVKAKKG